MKRPRPMSTDGRIMSDADVAAFLGISKKTLQRRVAKPVPGEIDLNGARPVTIGCRRLWLREDVERLVGIEPAPAKAQTRKGAAA